MLVKRIPLSLIDEDQEQPRYNFNEESLKELADSIKEVGLLNPIKVKILENGRYKIIFGNRRFKACKLLNLIEISAIISENESEVDIYLEQLTENIQREGFNPIEEAEAFNRLLNDEKFQMTKKLLAISLGKTEKYINQKIDLLIFGKEIQQLIHAGKDILPDKLTEEQVLPLKNVAIEYRDILARKMAAEEVAVKDVRNISKLFLAKDISSKSKEILLNKPIYQLMIDWSEYKKSQKENTPKPVLKVVDYSEEKTDLLNNHFSYSNYHQIAIVKKLHSLLNAIPSRHVISEDVISSIEEIKIAEKEEFLSTVDGLIDCFLGHVQEWKEVRAKASITKLGVVKKIN